MNGDSFYDDEDLEEGGGLHFFDAKDTVSDKIGTSGHSAALGNSRHSSSHYGGADQLHDHHEEDHTVTTADHHSESGDAEDNDDGSSSSYPFPVGDVTCWKHIQGPSPVEFMRLHWRWLRLNKAQILSGVTVALAQIPEAVSFSFVAGVDPIVGLQSAWIMGLVTSLAGASNESSSCDWCVYTFFVSLISFFVFSQVEDQEWLQDPRG